MPEMIQVKMNRAGVIAALTAPGVGARLLAMGNAAAAAARAGSGGGKFEVSLRRGRTRSRVSVITADRKARRAEATSRSLLRALDAARRA